MKTARLFTAATAVLALSLGASACGSGSSTSTQETTNTHKEAPAGTSSSRSPKADGASKAAVEGSGADRSSTKHSPESPPPEPHFTPRPHHDSAGGSKQFVQKGGDNSVQEYGGERSGSEFSEAAAALHTYLDARAAGAWDAACEALAAGVAEQLTDQFGTTAKGPSSCAEVLAAVSSGLPPRVLREAAIADVAALRADGDSGFLLLKGARDQAFFIPMLREDGHWKVAGLAPSSLP